MKKVGIVGGIGPESTLDYYKGIIDAFKADYEKNGYPEIGIESVNIKEFTAMANSGEWSKMALMIAERFEKLRSGGAEIGAIASNTPHKVFDEIQSQTRLPLINIVEATATSAAEQGVKTCILLGTRFTMESGLYDQFFNRKGMSIVVPDKAQRDYINKKVFDEIEFGIIKEDTRKEFLRILYELLEKSGADGAIMGCTELPLIYKPEDMSCTYLNTTGIHIDAIVSAIRA